MQENVERENHHHNKALQLQKKQEHMADPASDEVVA